MVGQAKLMKKLAALLGFIKVGIKPALEKIAAVLILG